MKVFFVILLRMMIYALIYARMHDGGIIKDLNTSHVLTVQQIHFQWRADLEKTIRKWKIDKFHLKHKYRF